MPSLNTKNSILSNAINVDSSYNVGIGTSSPQSILHAVKSNSTAPTSGTTPSGYALSYGSGDGNNGGLWFSADFGGDQGISGIAGTRVSGYQTDLRFYINNTNSARAFSERMRIRSSGVITIGAVSGTSGVLDIKPGAATSDGVTLSATYTGSGSYGPFIFQTSDVERMRITSGGNVLIGTTSDNGSKLQINGNTYSNAYRINDTGGGWVTLNMQNAERWSINYLGRFAGYGAGTLTTDGNGFITASSDRTLKDIIKPVENVLDKIMEFEPVYFKWNDKTDLDKENVYISTIAQSIEKSFPEAVGKMADGTLTVQDRAVMAILVKAIQELKAEIDILKQQ